MNDTLHEHDGNGERVPSSQPETVAPNTTYMDAHAPSREGEKRGPVGPIIGVVIIIAILLFGALYFWGSLMNNESEPVPYIPADESANQTDALEAEFYATDPNTFETQVTNDLNTFESEAQ